MFSSTIPGLTSLLTTYGYWAVFACIAIESTGIPFPGETMLLVAAIYVGTTHQLSLPIVIAAAASGAILGDNLGFWVGREGGSRLLQRYGRALRLDERKLKLGLYLFMKHGGKVVFFGRFVALLRMWAAFLAGTNRMEWKRFLLFNAASGIVWATLYGVGGYLLGDNVHRLTGPIGIVALVLAALVILAFLVFVRRNEHRLEDEAERVLPGPLDAYQTGGLRATTSKDSADMRQRPRGRTTKLRWSFQANASQEEEGVRGWIQHHVVCCGVMALGVLTIAVGGYLLVALQYHERAYAVLAVGAFCLLAGTVGRYARAGWSLLSRLPPLLLTGLMALGGLVPAAAVAVLAARVHENASVFVAAGRAWLTAEYHVRASVLLALGVFCLLAGIVVILLSVKVSKKGALP